MTAPITEEMWRRMPWHPKAKIIAAIDAELDRKRAELQHLRILYGQAFDADVAQTLTAAKAYLAAAEPDPDALEHMEVLMREIEATGRGRRHGDHGQFIPNPRSQETAA